MTILNVDNLGKYFGSRAVFRFVSFTVGEGERVAIVGRNGEGKTSLLRVIAGELEADEGSFSIVGKRTIGYLSQDEPEFNSTVLGETLSSHEEVVRLEQKMRDLEKEMELSDSAIGEYARVVERFELLDGYNLEHKAKSVLTGLGFAPETFHKDAGHLSGGERVRLALAKLLLLEPDLLVLDEPTNHVDLMGVEFLEQFLSTYKGAVLLVSHDRYFLDKTVHKVIELEDGRAKTFSGNYSQYLAQKEAELKRQAQAYERQQELIKKTRAWIRRFKSNYNLVRTARSREKMLERLDIIEKPKIDKRTMGLRFDEREQSGNDVLLLDSLSKGYPIAYQEGANTGFRWLFRDFTYLVKRGHRVALIGPNGCGKTTMIRCVLGIDRDYKGKVVLGQNVDVGYFSQGLDDLSDDNTILEEIKKLALQNQEARDLLGRFLFSGEEVDKKVSNLSGGERNRLALAKLVVGKANFLVLDEPTNHLDMPSKEVLESSLEDFPGTILFASHDRFFIEKLATHLWIFDGTRIRVFEGKYSDYRAKVLSGEPIEFENEKVSFGLGLNVSKRSKDSSPPTTQKPKDQRSSQPKAKGATRPRNRSSDAVESMRKVQELEEIIAALEEKRQDMLTLFSDPDAYANPEDLPWKDFDDLEKELELLYEKWEILSEKMYKIDSG
jgi:ATP-binding cassette subfamily F protein 3